MCSFFFQHLRAYPPDFGAKIADCVRENFNDDESVSLQAESASDALDGLLSYCLLRYARFEFVVSK